VAFRNKHLFNSCASPRRLAQEVQTRPNRRMVAKTANGHTCAQRRPSVPCDQRRDDGFQCDPVQGITGMGHGVRLIHGWCRHEDVQGTDCEKVSQGGLVEVGWLVLSCHIRKRESWQKKYQSGLTIQQNQKFYGSYF